MWRQSFKCISRAGPSSAQEYYTCVVIAIEDDIGNVGEFEGPKTGCFQICCIVFGTHNTFWLFARRAQLL